MIPGELLYSPSRFDASEVVSEEMLDFLLQLHNRATSGQWEDVCADSILIAAQNGHEEHRASRLHSIATVRGAGSLNQNADNALAIVVEHNLTPYLVAEIRRLRGSLEVSHE